MSKPLPMPVHIIYNNPGWMMGDPISRGAIASVIFPWWLSGCPEIDVNQDMKLQELAGLTHTRWHRHRDYVKGTLVTLCDSLRKVYKRHEEKLALCANRNHKASLRLQEYNRKRKIERMKDIKFSEADKDISSVSGRVDAQLPSKIEGHGQHTPNSFKHRPPKSQGTLRDK